MEIIFDPAKNQSNIVKHGVSLVAANDFEWDEAIYDIDDRKDYGEVRQCAIGPIGDRLYVVVFVVRNEAFRIISLRKANSREVKRYVEET